MGFWKRLLGGSTSSQQSSNNDAEILAQINALVGLFLARPPWRRPKPIGNVTVSIWSNKAREQKFTGISYQTGKEGWYWVNHGDEMVTVATDGKWTYVGYYVWIEWKVGKPIFHVEQYTAGNDGFMQINRYEADRLSNESNGPERVLVAMRKAIDYWNTRPQSGRRHSSGRA